MQQLTLQYAADYLENATIEHTHDAGYTIIHTGRNAAGARFALMNDCNGETTISESL